MAHKKENWKSTIKKTIFMNEKMEITSTRYKAICGLCEKAKAAIAKTEGE